MEDETMDLLLAILYELSYSKEDEIKDKISKYTLKLYSIKQYAQTPLYDAMISAMNKRVVKEIQTNLKPE